MITIVALPAIIYTFLVILVVKEKMSSLLRNGSYTLIINLIIGRCYVRNPGLSPRKIICSGSLSMRPNWLSSIKLLIPNKIRKEILVFLILEQGERVLIPLKIEEVLSLILLGLFKRN